MRAVRVTQKSKVAGAVKIKTVSSKMLKFYQIREELKSQSFILCALSLLTNPFITDDYLINCSCKKIDEGSFKISAFKSKLSLSCVALSDTMVSTAGYCLNFSCDTKNYYHH